MIPLLIFSKDRACQLDLLIRSVYKHCPQLMPYVVWKATDAEYKTGYEVLMDRYILSFFREETKIQSDLVDFLQNLSYNTGDLFALATDDTVFYRSLFFSDKEIEDLLDNETFTVSLRMGLNNTIQNYQTCEKQVPINFYDEITTQLVHPKWIKWNWLSYPPHSNPGYPMGQDMHIYRKRDFLEQLLFPIESMRQVESDMVNDRNRIEKEFMVSPYYSVAVNIPANNSQEPFIENEFNSYSLKELNDRFLGGQEIDLEEIEKTEVVGCHQPINYSFKEYNG